MKENKANIEMGKLIKFYRKKKGIGNIDFAKSIGVHWGTLSRWENGKGSLRMSLTTFIKLMHTLKVDADVLIGGIKL